MIFLPTLICKNYNNIIAVYHHLTLSVNLVPVGLLGGAQLISCNQ